MNLKVLKLIDINLKNKDMFKSRINDSVILLLPRLRVLKLKSIKHSKEKLDCNIEDIICAMMNNRSIQRLSLVDLGLGKDSQTR